MRGHFKSAATAAMWCLALAVAFTSARYFLLPPRLLLRTEMLALTRHTFWTLLHIAGGMVAITIGPFQFVGRLRMARPVVHRALGFVYLAAVSVAGCTGLLLSPDTSVFAADGLTDLTKIDLSFMGLSPSFLGYSQSSSFSPSQFLLVKVGFVSLALTWLLTGVVAFNHAHQKRFDNHRHWMIRNYSLTFAAATVRLAGLPFLVLTRNPVVAITCTFWSWVLNLAVAEWFTGPRSEVVAAH